MLNIDPLHFSGFYLMYRYESMVKKVFWKKSLSRREVRKNQVALRTRRSPLVEQLESRTPMAFDVLDPSFGPGGTAKFDSTSLSGTIDYTSASIVAPDGKVIVAASTDGAFVNTFVSRYNANGTIDSSFGQSGTITLPELGPIEMAFTTNGDLLVLGAYYSDQVSGDSSSRLYRFTSTGAPVTTFGSLGFVSLASTTTFEQYNFLEVTSSGSIYVVGSEGFEDLATVYARKLTASGAPDTSFGPGGKRLLTVAGYGVTPTDTELDAAGRLVIVGQAEAGVGISTAVMRVNSNGVFDNTFDGDGRRVFNMGATGDYDESTRLAIGADGSLFVSAINTNFASTPSTSVVKVAKLSSTGAFVTTFGTTGIKALPDVLGNKITAASSIVVDPTLGLTMGVDTLRTSIHRSGLVRLNTLTGALETSFGTSGLALIPFFGSSLSFPNSLSVLNGEFTVSGGIGGNSGSNIGVAQLSGTTGNLDATFGTRGRLAIDYSNFGTFNPSVDTTLSMDASPNGSVFVAGKTSGPYSFLGSFGLVTKLTTSGKLDASFGFLGRVALENLIEVSSVVAASDGSVLVVGSFLNGSPFDQQANTDFAVVKLRADGDIDTTFGVGGYSLIDFGGTDKPTSLIAGASGQWIVAGSTLSITTGSRIAVARLNANGIRDFSFDGDGRVVVTTSPSTSEFATDVKLDSAGRIVVAGSAAIVDGGGSFLSSQFLAVRLLATGALDTSFNGSGVLTRSLGVINELYVASSLQILSDNSLVLAGTVIRNSATDSDFLLMAFTPTGAVRTSFGTSGAVRTDFPRSGGSADTLAGTIRSNNQIIAVGASNFKSGTTSRGDAVLTAYNALTGALDSTFATGSSNRLTVPLPVSPSNGGVAIDIVGGLLYVGGNITSTVTSGDMFVARYGQSAPTITGVANAAYTENAAPVALMPIATITDLDATNYNNGKLTVQFASGQQAGDVLTIRSVGTGVGQVSLSGSNVLFQGVVIGTWSGGATTPLQVVFNAQSTAVRVSAVLRNITYSTPSENPAVTPRVVRFTVVDSTGLSSAPVLSTITVTPVNDAPTMQGIATTLAYRVNTAAVLVAGSSIVGDADHANFSGGQLSLRFTSGVIATNRLTLSGLATLNAANQVLVEGVVIGTLNAGGGVGLAPLTITFTANATTARVQTLLRNIRFSTVSGVAGTRSLELAITDPAKATTKATQSIVVS